MLSMRWARQKSLRGSQSSICALRRGRDVDIVQERVQTLLRLKLGAEVKKSGMLSESVQSRHEGVSLFAALSLQHFVPRAFSHGISALSSAAGSPFAPRERAATTTTGPST